MAVAAEVCDYVLAAQNRFRDTPPSLPPFPPSHPFFNALLDLLVIVTSAIESHEQPQYSPLSVCRLLHDQASRSCIKLEYPNYVHLVTDAYYLAMATRTSPARYKFISY